MGGKALLFVVLGFSLILLVKGNNMNSASNRSVVNMVDYYTNLNAHNIAVSGANIAASKIFLEPDWTGNYNDAPFSGGQITVSVSIIDVENNIRKIVSIGSYLSVKDTVEIIVRPSSFSKYAYYSNSEGGVIYWADGDTVWGPMHTQDYLRISGSPVFWGKVSTKLGLKSDGYWTGPWWNRKWVMTADPKFYGGFESSVNEPMKPTSVSDIQTNAASDGHVFIGHDTVYTTFAGDSIKYRYSYNSKDTTVYGKTFAPNGIIFASNAVLRIKGIVKGQYTIGASGTSGTKGNIYLDNNIVYNTDPKLNSNSTDMLGIVAEKNVYITDNPDNNQDINIDGSIFCLNGGFGAQNYDSRPVAGNINLFGGVQQNTRLPVGTFTSDGISSGFSKKYSYDERLRSTSPPSYPDTGQFEIVSWYE